MNFDHVFRDMTKMMNDMDKMFGQTDFFNVDSHYFKDLSDSRSNHIGPTDEEARQTGLRDVILRPGCSDQDNLNDSSPQNSFNKDNLNDCSLFKNIFHLPDDYSKNMCNSVYTNDDSESPFVFKSVIKNTGYEDDGSIISTSEIRDGKNVTIIKEIVNLNGEKTVTNEIYDADDMHALKPFNFRNEKISLNAEIADDCKFQSNRFRDVLLKPKRDIQIQLEETNNSNELINPIHVHENVLNNPVNEDNEDSTFKSTFDYIKSYDLQNIVQNDDLLKCSDCPKKQEEQLNSFEDFIRNRDVFFQSRLDHMGNILSNMHPIYENGAVNESPELFKSIKKSTRYESDGTKISSSETKDGSKVTIFKEIINPNGEQTITTEIYNIDSSSSPLSLDSTTFDKPSLIARLPSQSTISVTEGNGFVSSIINSFAKFFS